MKQFLVAIHRPNDYDPAASEDAEMIEGIHALNREMIAANARFFAGGLRPLSEARSLRKDSGGKVQVTDGPYLETKEHIGGFWILDCEDMDQATEWGRKAVIACRAPVEVRPFFFRPPA